MAKITISEIAKRAGVSKTAVSFAFNDPARLPDATVQRILAVAEEVGYIPNPVARSLSNNHTGNLGLLFPQPLPDILANPYMLDLLRGVGKACDAEGYNMMLVSPILGSMNHAVSGAVVDGFLTIGLEHYKATIALLDRREIPYVMIDSEPFDGAACVNVDDEAGAYAAMRHVLDHGHRRIAIFGIESGKHGLFETYVGTIHRRMVGYRRALHELGMDVDGEQITLIECVCTHEGGYNHLVALLESGALPTAIVCMADIVAAGVLDAATERGIRVPDALSIIGYDDLPLCRWTNPPLSTVSQPSEEKGQYAAELLLQILQGNASLEHHVFPTRLVQRASIVDVR
jgi:DNA-binding LacI/PurR family transcriptional regulator